MKERMLTVLVPIKDSDATVVTSLPAVTPDNINVIYKHEGVYKRIWLNPTTKRYEYHEVIDREFPYLGKPLEIFDFTYDATRMGSAPTISAQNVMWYADKDENNNDVTLEDLWLARNNDCHVTFNGENFYLKQVPTSSKGNDDARYKYDIDFVSERIVLENVYIYDVVQPFVTERPISESSSFSFFGDVNELAKRINASLLRSGLAKLELRDGVTSYLTYEQFNSLGLGTYPFPDDMPYNARVQFRYRIYVVNNGDYNKYLQTQVYKVVDGEFVQSGYICRIGKDKKGELTTSEEKLITFDNNTIHEALQQVHDTFELQYYIYSEKNSDGDFTGNTIIMIADCEHDFADVDGDDYVRDDDGIPTTEHPFDYGVDNELLAKEKTNTTDKIITRITGIGSEENIPWHYPNPTADGWIKPVYKINGEVQEIDVDYPTSEGSTTPENVRYEKYLKNRIGDVFTWGVVKDIINKTSYKNPPSGIGYYTDDQSQKFINLVYPINAKTGYSIPKFTLEFSTISGSNSGRVIARLHDNTINQDVGNYDSDIAYISPTSFQQAFITGDSSVVIDITPGHIYYLYISIDIVNGLPLSQKYDFIGQYYPPTIIENTSGDIDCHVPDGFYETDNLIATAKWVVWTAPSYYVPSWGGYSLDGTYETRQNPLPRINGKYFKDATTGSIYKCTNSGSPNVQTGTNQNGYTVGPEMDFEEWVLTYLNLSIKIIDANGWYKKSQKRELYDFGLLLNSSVTPNVFDTIEFQRVKYVTPQPNLMPEVYIKTDGERRFYNAVNYPLSGGTPDPMIGEEESGGQIINPIYYKEDSTTHFDFENEYIQSRPHEHIEPFDDVKPTIKGQVNTVDGRTFRIDVVEEFAYDELDNDEVWESNDGGNVSGEYKHPYFFAKLRPLGFNLFDLALQEDMVLSMTTGHCGACNFKIGVDENTKKNPVQIWEYDVYEGSDWDTKTFKYSAGTLRRYVDTSDLYYDTDGTSEGYTKVDTTSSNTAGFLVPSSDITSFRTDTFSRQTYSSEEVVNGEVGSLRKDGKNHFEGDVKTNGKFIASQQDTSENYVWVALMKDTDTYGVIMPAARPDYADGIFSVYIRPKSIADVHTDISTDSEDEENADKFVLTNIRMPQVYLRRAEKELSKRLVAYMYDNNYQKFNFTINFSRIFLAQNPSDEAFLNENSVIYVSFNNRTYRQYVKHYSYRMTRDNVLPEISVDMNEELSVSRTQVERQTANEQRLIETLSRRANRFVSIAESRITRSTIGRNEDAIVGGNLVSRDAVTSFGELQTARLNTTASLLDTQVDLEVNHYRRTDFEIDDNGRNLRIGDNRLRSAYVSGDVIRRDVWNESEGEYQEDTSYRLEPAKASVFNSFVSSVNTFNTNVADKIMSIRYTMEGRFNMIQNGECTRTELRVYDWKDNHGVAFWTDSTGSDVSTTGTCPAEFNISWNDFNTSNTNT